MTERPNDEGPYVGPRPFYRTERDVFYGRDHEARALASLVVAHRVVLLYAASGAGKTSLLNAGAIPVLEDEDGFEVLPPVRLRGLADGGAPGNPFLANLLHNLAREMGEERPSASTLADLLADRPHAEGDDGLPAPRAIVIDQMEELFALYPERWPCRSEVFGALREALDRDPLLRLVLAIREDYVAQLDPYADLLPTRLRTRMRLEPLRRPAALAAVARPVDGRSRWFAPGVPERLVDDLLRIRIHTSGDDNVEVIGEFVEPVQLQVVCRSLWSTLPAEAAEIGEAELARMGGVSDVLSRYYGEAVRAAAAAGKLPEPDLRERLEAAFVTPVGTRGTVVGAGERIAGIPAAAIAEFEARHLLRAEWRAGARWLELAHDSLIRPIVTSNAELRRRRERRRERRLKRAVAGLVALAGVLLALLLLPGDEPTNARPPLISVVEARAPLAGLRLARTLTASGEPVAMRSAVGGRVLVVGAGDGRIRVWDINAGREVATLDYGDTGLSSVDVDERGTQIVAAGRLGLRRWRTQGLGTRPPGAVEIRRRRLPTNDDLRAVTAAALPADAPRSLGLPAFLTLSEVAVIRNGVGELESYPDVLPFAGRSQRLFSGKVVRIAYSPARTAVVAVDVDGVARLREVRPDRNGVRAPIGRERILSPPGPRASVVSAVAFGRKGRLIVTASADGVARLWRTRGARLLKALPRAPAPLRDAAVSPDGALVATAGADGMLRVWSTEGRSVAVIRASRRPLSAVSWGAAGQVLVTAASDAVVRVWANPAVDRPLAARTCSAAQFLLPASPRDVGARATDGKAYITSVSCPAGPGEVIHAPEAGTLTTACGPRSQPRVALLATGGRCWVFRGGRPVGRRRHVEAGAEIGRVERADPEGVRIELWEHARSRRRVGNAWNPMLFLDVRPAASPAYPGDAAPRARIARWMGRKAQAVGLPPELPVVAALVSSGLRNLSGGDRDSVGYFQMRLSIWNFGAYAGFAKRPDLQLRWFTDQAKRVRERDVALGRDPLQRPECYGSWAADVIIPAERFRARFQRQLGQARGLLGLPRGRIPSLSACTPPPQPTAVG
ncbi:MAG TPA: WD40 repeat domain-containing protein [Solirubrobacteraceae bacterium]|nr:WD40 repeat domain-containing protein [Solirubrobacteraceae bacterium]